MCFRRSGIQTPQYNIPGILHREKLSRITLLSYSLDSPTVVSNRLDMSSVFATATQQSHNRLALTGTLCAVSWDGTASHYSKVTTEIRPLDLLQGPCLHLSPATYINQVIPDTSAGNQLSSIAERTHLEVRIFLLCLFSEVVIHDTSAWKWLDRSAERRLLRDGYISSIPDPSSGDT